MTWLDSLQKYLFKPMDNSPLVIFRIVFGFLLAAEGFGAIATGWVYQNFILPTHYHFPFIPFEWLTPLPGYGMYFYYIMLGIFGLMVMLGWYYRIGIIGYAILWTGCYFMQKISYNNHYYLMFLLCWVVATMDLHRYGSLDAKRNPAIQSLTCPHWYKVFLIGMLCMVFMYASKAKWYPGWYDGTFISMAFHAKRNFWLIGPWLQYEWLQDGVTWGGIIFDFIVIPMLMIRQTRWPAFVLFTFFNLFNSVVFHIGIFPYLMIGSAVLFFTPEVVRKRFFPHKPKPDLTYHHAPLPAFKRIGLAAYTLFCIIQLLLPIRYHFIEGDVLWTEEGHRLSWRMMLRIRTGSSIFYVKDHDSQHSEIITPGKYLTPKQNRQMSTHPDMIWQFAQWLKRKYAKEGKQNISIYVESRVKVNKSEYYPVVDPCADLANAQWKWYKHNEWIIPYPYDYTGPETYD